MGGMIHFVEMVRTPLGAFIALILAICFAFYLKWLLAEPEDEASNSLQADSNSSKSDTSL